jgi:hypothetical protein
VFFYCNKTALLLQVKHLPIFNVNTLTLYKNMQKQACHCRPNLVHQTFTIWVLFCFAEICVFVIYCVIYQLIHAVVCSFIIFTLF